MPSQERIKDLIAELENIYMLLEDGCNQDAIDELRCQSGTIETIINETIWGDTK